MHVRIWSTHGKLVYTEQRGIVLSKTDSYPWIDRQLDIATWSDQKDDYIVYTMERTAGKLENNIEKRLCNSKFAELSDSSTQIIINARKRLER